MSTYSTEDKTVGQGKRSVATAHHLSGQNTITADTAIPKYLQAKK